MEWYGVIILRKLMISREFSKCHVCNSKTIIFEGKIIV